MCDLVGNPEDRFSHIESHICGEFLETEEELTYLCSENKGADQLRGDTVQLICAFVFTLCKKHVFSQCGSYEQHHKKTCFCKCENKDADQLCGNWAADQRLCFRYIDLLIEKVEGLYYDDNSTITLLSQPIIIFFGCIYPKADQKKR